MLGGEWVEPAGGEEGFGVEAGPNELKVEWFWVDGFLLLGGSGCGWWAVAMLSACARS